MSISSAKGLPRDANGLVVLVLALFKQPENLKLGGSGLLAVCFGSSVQRPIHTMSIHWLMEEDAGLRRGQRNLVRSIRGSTNRSCLRRCELMKSCLANQDDQS